MSNPRYPSDVLAGNWRRKQPPPAKVPAELGTVVETADQRFCGAIVELEKDAVLLEDRHGRRRSFPLEAGGFLVEGRPATLVRPPRTPPARSPRTASGSVALAGVPAQVARASRIFVEGTHDATLIERVWGDDLRIEGIVVEPLHGVDELPDVVDDFRPGPTRRLGVLVDHLVPGSKEARIAAAVASRTSHVLVAGHPFVDIWQAVKPASVGIRRWPEVPRGRDWKEGVCEALGVPDVGDMWRRVLAGVRSYADLEVPLLRAVEQLVDFVTVPA